MPRASAGQWRRSTTPSASVLRPGVGRYQRFHSRPGDSARETRRSYSSIASASPRRASLIHSASGQVRAFRTSRRAGFQSRVEHGPAVCRREARPGPGPPLRRRAGGLCGGELRGHQRQLIGQVVQHVVAAFPKGRHRLRRSLRTRAICWAAWEEDRYGAVQEGADIVSRTGRGA